MDEKLRILLCEDDENLGMLFKRIFTGKKVILLSYILMEKPVIRLS